MTEGPHPRYEPIAVSSESTVVAEFVPEPGTAILMGLGLLLLAVPPRAESAA